MFFIENSKALHLITLLVLLALGVLFPLPSHALEPFEIVVVANSREQAGVELARFYMQERNVPEENILILNTAITEGINRHIYEAEIAEPIREFLADKPKISCLVLMYGLPLRINGRLQSLKNMLIKQADISRRQRDPVASVDSELCLVRVDNPPVFDWIANPYFLQFQKQETRYRKGEVLMVARLDGPGPVIVKRIITDSLEIEKRGLTGTAYFDARWSKPASDKQLSGYALYDNSIHKAAELTEKILPVIVNEEESLFQHGEAPDAALYCGWYSLSLYQDAFEWKPGSVAYHIASGECSTLKKKGSQVWCKRLLEEGVAATIGPVGEPYVQAFPLPQIFFGLLLDGDFTLAEAYFLSLPFISWKMVLIGDPLYQPFRQRGVVP